MGKKQLLRRNYDVFLFLAAMLPVAVMLFAKCKYGIGNRDESFYLTVPYRLCQGDRLFLNEWHLSQMAGWILQFPMALFLKWKGSTEGMVLAFRQIYVAVHLVGSTVLFWLLRRKSRLGAVVAALCYCIYTPFGISALSYNSMGLGLLTLSAATVTCARGRWSNVAAGALYALSVLCCPYLAVLLPVYGCGVLAARRFPKFGEGLPFLVPRQFGMYVLGIGIPAVLFLLSVLPRIPLTDWPRIVAGMFRDPEHSMPLWEKPVEYVRQLVNHRLILFLLPLLLCGLLVRQRVARAVTGGLVLALTVLALRQSHYINFLMFPMSQAGLYFYLVYRSASTKPLFYGLWIPGMVYSLCLHMASNQGYFAISHAFTVSTVASVLIILLTVQEQLPGLRCPVLKCGLAVAVALLFFIQGYYQVRYRWQFVYWENSLAEQTQPLTAGPDKGLLVSPQWEQEYTEALQLTSRLNPQGSLLVLGGKSYYYLFTGCTNSSYSGWPAGTPESILERLEIYYRLCPDKRPEQILIPAENSDYAGVFLEDGSYRLAEASPGGDLLLTRAETAQ